MEKIEAISVLEELLIEIKEKIEEAFEIVSEIGSEITIARAKSYWYSGLLMELDEEHGFLGGSMCTLQDTINELMADDEEYEE